MRKIFSVLISAFLLTGALASCNNADDEQLQSPSLPSEAVTEEATTLASDYSDFDTDERAYAVMIDNDGNSSRPHAGLEDAYIIYEMYVEGSATRLMAIFKGADTPKIGPVRSSRHYFLEYVSDNDALYSHAGFSPLAMEQIQTMHIDNMNGLVYEPNYYWRERKYSGDYHSLFTSIGNLSNLADHLGYRKTSDSLPFEFSSNPPTYEGDSATDITIPYAPFYYVSYKYDEKTKLYDRYINSELHPTQSGEKLQAGQIIMQFASNTSLGDGSDRQDLKTTGKGNGIFIRDGVATPITWSRKDRSSKLRFYTQDGKELVLDSTRQTYVQVLPESLSYTIK